MQRVSGSDAWEGMCRPEHGCKTACCYYQGSPCEELRIMNTKTNRGVCRVYPTRFGVHKTVAGETFQCVPYAAYLKHQPAHPKCGYAVVKSIEGMPVVRGQA